MTNQKMERKLQARHITMIAIGGCIGTGLFMALMVLYLRMA